MKLTKNKLVEIIGKKNEGWTTYQARKLAGVSIRRVNQVYRQYLLTEQIPEIRQYKWPTKKTNRRLGDSDGKGSIPEIQRIGLYADETDRKGLWQTHKS